MRPTQRRFFLKKSAFIALSGLGGFFGMHSGHAARTGNYFSNRTFSESLQTIFNGQALIDSSEITAVLPQVAENGAVIPISISSELDNIRRIFILVEKNPTQLAAEITLSPNVPVYLTARIKMAESCDVWVVADQNGQLLCCRRWVKVVQGGCGTG